MPSLNNGEPRSSGVIPPKKVTDLDLLAVECRSARTGFDTDEVSLNIPTSFTWHCGVRGHEREASPMERAKGREACHQRWRLEQKKGLAPLVSMNGSSSFNSGLMPREAERLVSAAQGVAPVSD
jgi:hypothetical protein